ncbi:LOW QUALITY PROTEIN: hypothetical protein HID58_032978 [Brassica napus]|uniref:Protein kinase domain-containing protein n=1 Tax=Brassica napus TaxID=3708 RepID=A0ABQ8BXW8_BRANA|nr:LOW QUALITY PROTEIN: hypothetical protein HID58_032978 [Brassica napus]
MVRMGDSFLVLQIIEKVCVGQIVVDFGLSKWKNATFLSTRSGKGTPQWMAPEVLRSEPPNDKCDLWNHLMGANDYFNSMGPSKLYQVVGFMDRRLDLPERLKTQIASIVEDCWQTDPAKRPSFEVIISRMMSLFCKAGSSAQEEED